MPGQSHSPFNSRPAIKIHSAGPLRDASAKRAGMMIIFEHENREAAEQFVKDSPYLQAGLYEDYKLYEYENEAG